MAHEADRWLGEARPSQPIIPGINFSLGGGDKGQDQGTDGKGKGKEMSTPVGQISERVERDLFPRPLSPHWEEKEEEDEDGADGDEPPALPSETNNRESGRQPKQ